MLDHLRNEKDKIYLVFMREDIQFADWIEDQLNSRNISVRRYDKNVGGSTIPDNQIQWSKESSFVLLLVSNKWKNLSSYLQGELATILVEKNNRNYQYIFALSLEELSENVLNRVVQYCNCDVITKDNHVAVISRLAKIFSQRPLQNDVISGVYRLPQTNTLPTPFLKLNDSVYDLMTEKPRYFITGQADVAELTAFWTYKGFRHFPITDEYKHLVGLASLRDILKLDDPEPEVLEFIGVEGGLVFPDEIPVERIMTPHLPPQAPLVTLKPEDTVEKAIWNLYRRHDLGGNSHRISILPVIDDLGILQGIVSYIDVLKKCILPNGIIQDYMTDIKKRRIHAVTKKESLKRANREMGAFRDLPVLEDQESKIVVGMVSDYEMRKNLRLPQVDKYDTTNVPVDIVMKSVSDLPYLTATNSIDIAVKVFLMHRKLNATVVYEEGSQMLRGIIGYIDILRAMLPDHLTR